MKYSGIGGQAVLEGIMMKNKDNYDTAVRKPDGEIVVKKDTYVSMTEKVKFFSLPFVRGIFNFADSMILGMRSLTWSASFFEDDEEDEEPGKFEKFLIDTFGEKVDNIVMSAVMVFSVLMAIAIFMVLPLLIAGIFRKFIHSETVMAILEGCIRIGIFITYIKVISRMNDIKRTFMYHGSEHKCINCVEHGLPLTVENVLASSRQHKRCGTSFLFLVMIVSIFLHFIFVLVPGYWVRLFGRLLMVPIVSGVSFELIQWAGRTDSRLADILSKPGLAMQKLTTKEPTADMAEVAIAAVEAVFDWREYLKEEFGWKPEENEEKNADI